MKIGIIGYGHVGKAMHKMFGNAHIYDPNTEHNDKSKLNNLDAAFICVPTPEGKDGMCDTSLVEEVLSWVDAKVSILRSTVYVGFTDYAVKKFKKNIVFQPEYYGETVNHPFSNLSDRQWLAFGGTQESIDLAIEAYKMVINSNVKIHMADAVDVEMAKYMENTFLGMKVTFCNEMYDAAKALGANYNKVREIWTADPRIGTSHTFVYENNRGYGGKCLPKDIKNINKQMIDNNVDNTFINSMINKNIKIRNMGNNE